MDTEYQKVTLTPHSQKSVWWYCEEYIFLKKAMVAAFWTHFIMQADVGELDQVLELRTLTENHYQLPETVQPPARTRPQQSTG